MAKIKLGNRPVNFKRTVSFPLLDGDEGSIECVFKYRTRTEFGKFIDGLVSAGREKLKEKQPEGAPVEDVGIGAEKFQNEVVIANAVYLLDVLEAWNLDVELSRDSVCQLADELPAAVEAVMNAYRLACVEGRLGN